MKKYILAFGLITTSFLTPSFAQADSDLLSAWRQWVLSRRATSTAHTTTTTTSTSRPTRAVSRSRYLSRYYARRKAQNNKASKLRVNVHATKPQKVIHKIESTPVKIFDIGVKQDKSSQYYREAVVLDSAKFKMFNNSGIAQDAREFSLLVNGEYYDFEQDGTVEVELSEIRIPQGEDFSFEVKIGLNDLNIPHVPGQFMVRLEELVGYGELSHKKVEGTIYGSAVSKAIEYDPAPYASNNTSLIQLQEEATIYGRTLESGEKAFVLVGRFAANYDDIYIRRITLRNSLTGNNLDSLIYQVKAFHLETGAELDSTRFVNGAAEFRFSPEVFVGRNNNVRIGFQVEVEDPLERSSVDTRLKLKIEPEDLIAQSASTGNDLSNANKMFTVDSEIFTIARGRMVLNPSENQYSYAVGTNRPETVYRFKMSGADVSVGRLSMDVYPSGLDFRDGSLTADDVKFVAIQGNREYEQDVNVEIDGNVIHIDFDEPYDLYRDTVEYGLQLALDDIPGNNDSDSLAIRLLGDSNYNKGTLSAMRNGGYNFVWVDDASARPSKAIWMTGYRVSGLPANTVVVKRFAN
jgi:hypothetical protein